MMDAAVSTLSETHIMAKNNSKRAASGGGESLAELHRKVERMDRELLHLINERAKHSSRAARLLKDADKPLVDSIGEQSQLQQLLKSNKGPLPEAVVRAVLRELFTGCRLLVKPQKVVYLGPQYSYSHQAAIEYFGSAAELAPVGTIAAVFDELNRAHADFGIVPIENSTDGRVVDTLDMFARMPVRICGEIQLRIHHNLLAKCPRGEVQEVYSKPQALSQCRDWLSKHLPGVRIVEMTSTAAAAQLAADKPGAAAVAGMQAAVNYGLQVLAENIEDNKHNVTRFAVIGDLAPRRTGNDKTALMLELLHKPGALADAMVVFKRGRLNLTWIESFPMPETKNEYLFFLELEGHQTDAKVRRALDALRKRTVRMEVLGSYPRANPLD